VADERTLFHKDLFRLGKLEFNLGVPVVPGCEDGVADVEEFREVVGADLIEKLFINKKIAVNSDLFACVKALFIPGNGHLSLYGLVDLRFAAGVGAFPGQDAHPDFSCHGAFTARCDLERGNDYFALLFRSQHKQTGVAHFAVDVPHTA
jgi:hypothetical protein